MDPIAALRRIIGAAVADRVYLRNYSATVERQHDDGTLDLLPDDDAIRGTGLSQVPIHHGLPGVTVRVAAGSRVLVGFVSGDPRKPYVSLWQSGSITEIRFNGGESPVARQGDVVAIYWPASLAITGTLTGAVSGAFSGTLTIGTQSAGVIQSGAARVKA